MCFLTSQPARRQVVAPGSAQTPRGRVPCPRLPSGPVFSGRQVRTILQMTSSRCHWLRPGTSPPLPVLLCEASSFSAELSTALWSELGSDLKPVCVCYLASLGLEDSLHLPGEIFLIKNTKVVKAVSARALFAGVREWRAAPVGRECFLVAPDALLLFQLWP